MNIKMQYIVSTMNALTSKKPNTRGVWNQDVKAIGRRRGEEIESVWGFKRVQEDRSNPCFQPGKSDPCHGSTSVLPKAFNRGGLKD